MNNRESNESRSANSLQRINHPPINSFPTTNSKTNTLFTVHFQCIHCNGTYKMPSLSTIQTYRSPMSSSATASILIKNIKQMNRVSEQSRTIENSHEVSRSAELMYDSATWRMYYRITNARRRSRLVEDRNTDVSTRLSTRNRDQNDNDLYKYSMKAMSERKDRQRSLSNCSDTSTSQNIHDEEIFTLDL